MIKYKLPALALANSMYLGQVPSELKDLTVVEAGRRGNDCSALASKPFGLLSRLCEKVAGSAGVNRPYGFMGLRTTRVNLKLRRDL